MFPVAPLAPLPGAASQTDKTILGPKLAELVAAVNALHARLAPVSVGGQVHLTVLQAAALDGIADGQAIELVTPDGAMILLAVLQSRVRVVVPSTAPAPGVPVIGLATTSINGGSVEEGETTPITGAIAVTNDGTGSLSGLGVSAVTYTQGSSGWLTPTWDAGNTEADWEIDPTGLTPGQYAANFDVTASNAEPVTVTAALTVTEVAAPPGDFTAPLYSLPAFATHDDTTDDIDGAPMTAPDIGSYA